MRHSFFGFVRLTLIVIFGWMLSACSQKKTPEEAEASQNSVGWLVNQVHTSDKVYTAEYTIHKVVSYSDDVHLRGNMFSNPFDVKVSVGDRKVLIPIDVTLKSYVDFSNFSSSNIQKDGQHLTITLPDPRFVVTATKVDQSGVRQFVDALRSRFSESEIDGLAAQGVDSIRNHIGAYDILSTARSSAVTMLLPMLVKMGYSESNVTIQFRKDLKLDNNSSLFDVEQQAKNIIMSPS